LARRGVAYLVISITMPGRVARRVAVLLGAAVVQAAQDPWYPYNNDTWASWVGSNSNKICKDGMLQSPIDFDACATPAERSPIEISWATQRVTLSNNGHTVSLMARGDVPGKMVVNGVSYNLVQCHFHWGSEHTVGAIQHPFEAHCVHTKDDYTGFGVFGLFFEVGDTESGFLRQFEDQLPSRPTRRLGGEPEATGFDIMGNLMDASTQRRLASSSVTSAYTGPLDFKELYEDLAFGDLRNYWDYKGSFTTPPCTEAVDFYIMMKTVKMTQVQLDKFKTAIGWAAAGGNFRPAQPLHGRVVSGCYYNSWYPAKNAVWASKVGSNSNSICQHGSLQSPIDFPTCEVATTRAAIAVTWASQAVELINNGHAVQLTAKATAPGTFVFEGNTYTLVQCHFHYGAEHTVGTVQHPFEAHCVHTHSDHTDEKPHYGVFGVFFEIGAENAFLKLFEDELPASPPPATAPPYVKGAAPAAAAAASDGHRRLGGEPSAGFDLFGNRMDDATKRRLAGSSTKSTYVGPLDFKGLYGSDDRTKFWDYKGSFTTPPCTEAVDFYIMMTKQTLSQNQLNKFKAAIGWQSAGGNFRPTQPVNHRLVSGCAIAAWYPAKNDVWAKLVGESSNTVCEHGTLQSPIDFAPCTEARKRSGNMVITWAEDINVTLTNNGHTVTLEPETTDSPGLMKVGGNIYKLVQCHFHYSSEHTVGGAQFPFEAHCVHSMEGAAWTRYGVFGVFFEIGAENAFLKEFEDQLPVKARRLSDEPSAAVGFDLFGEPMDRAAKRRLAGAVTSPYDGPLDFNKLYAGIDLTKYWDYSGSFTTPPCTEAVDFYIMMQPATLTQAQLDKFKAAIKWSSAKGNFRPAQPLNGRTVSGCAVASWYPYTSNNWATMVGGSSHQVCQDGMLQSPIDFPQCAAVKREAVEITWASQNVTLTNNGHTVQLTAKGPDPGKMVVGDNSYTLVQCHFHWGAEHTVSGKQHPFEAHCVHTKDGSTKPHYGVFGIFFRTTSSNESAFLKQFEDELPAAPSARRLSGAYDVMGNPMDAATKRNLAASAGVSTYVGPLDFKMLYGDNDRTNFWDYQGSFTTPPCTEAVDFYIMMEEQLMTDAQLTLFKNAIGFGDEQGNFRPPQPLFDRTIAGCQKAPDVETSAATCTRAAGASAAMAALAAAGLVA
jgi:carbonic anhydrase